FQTNCLIAIIPFTPNSELGEENQCVAQGGIYDALKHYENLLEKISRVMTYAQLLFAKNTKEAKFYSQCEMEL
ncbi:oligoendopeptidase F, partial [Helicobacter pylori]